MLNSNFQYIAFLRGINVGGHALIKMADLKKTFEKMGFKNVRSFLASGNVVFESERTDASAITKEIESGLKAAFNRDINVILRSLDDLKKLKSLEPFKGITVTLSTRLYVTFLSEKSRPRSIAIPYTSPQKEFSILHATPREVFSILDLSKGKGTPDVMNILKNEYGSNITTRNWNTILKVLK
jgi:uncharacterized protein (DUF1697 family)